VKRYKRALGASVGDLDGDPKSDILGQASFGIRTDRRPDIAA
jgi:hypothetical protein